MIPPPVEPPNRQQERDRIIGNIRRWRDKNQQLLADVEYWNTHIRQPDEAPIDIDPGGQIRRWIIEATQMLDADRGHGPIAPFMSWDGHSHEVH